MKYYPANLNIKDKHCLVVGGGAVGFRKVKTLLKCGAIITVISLKFCKELICLEKQGKIILKECSYKITDLENKFLVIGATDNKSLNRQIGKDAAKLNKLCNIADLPDESSFILPSIVHRGNLVISVSTCGKSPAFAKKIKIDLEKKYGEEYSVFLDLMGAIRTKLLEEKHDPKGHKQIFEKLIQKGLLEMCRKDDKPGINFLLSEIIGQDYKIEDLV